MSSVELTPRILEATPKLGGRLRKLLGHIDGLRLSTETVRIAYRVIDEILEQREMLALDRERYPEIAAEEIVAPIFVTGLPRSGTTLLHVLVGSDPNNRTPRMWEVARPSPPPGLGEEIDSRRRRTDRDIAELIRVDPSLLQAHPYFDEGGSAVAECEHLGVLDFHFVRRTHGYYSEIPAYIDVQLIESDEAFFHSHRQVLQHLQWRAPKKRWALKGTENFVRLAGLKAVYPDAHVIWIHRDPQKVFASIMEMYCALAEGMGGAEIDRPALAGQLLHRYGDMLDKALASNHVHHPDVLHLRYADFSADPVGAIRRAYELFDMPFDETTAAAIQNWKSNNQGDRHGKFKYSLESFGFDREALEERIGPYRAAFDIPFEGAKAA